MKPLSREEYFTFLKETGIDIDGRMEWTNNTLFPLIDQSIRRFIEFCKAIPGFTNLNSNDRATLVKGK